MPSGLVLTTPSSEDEDDQEEISNPRRLLGGPFLSCAKHVRQFGGVSPLPNLMEVKG